MESVRTRDKLVLCEGYQPSIQTVEDGLQTSHTVATSPSPSHGFLARDSVIRRIARFKSYTERRTWSNDGFLPDVSENYSTSCPSLRLFVFFSGPSSLPSGPVSDVPLSCFMVKIEEGKRDGNEGCSRAGRINRRCDDSK